MRTILIILLINVWLINVHCQTTTFVYNYIGGLNETPVDLIETDNENIIIISSMCDPGNSFKNCKGLIIKIDKYGNFIDSLVIDEPGKSLNLDNIIKDHNDNYLLSGAVKDSLSDVECMKIYRINEDLVLLEENEICFPLNNEILYVKIREGLSLEYVSTGILWVPYPKKIKAGNRLQMFVCRLNSSLDSIKCRIFDEYSTGGDIKQITTNKYWIITAVHGKYFILDSLLNTISVHSVIPNISDPFGIKWDTDTSFYLAGEWNGGPDDDIAFIHQYHLTDTANHNFNNWGTLDTLDLTARSGSLDYRRKDSIFIGGTTGFRGYFSPYPSWYFLIQTDSMLNIRWERFYGGYPLVVNKLITSKDGGCIMLAAIYNNSEEQNDIEVIKVNETGHFVGKAKDKQIRVREAIVYPNPGNESVNVLIASGYKESFFKLYDIHGNLIIKKAIQGNIEKINTQSLKKGMYIYRIYSIDGLHERGKWIKD